MKPQPTQPAASQRLLSLDALRGFDMLFIMGFAGLVTALCKLCPGEFSDWMTAQMGHADWNGFFHHDTIFPLFLFIAGISFPFSLAKQREKGMSERSIYLKVIRRGLTLVALGFVYSGLFKLDFATLRLPSVLGRIGLAWMFAALLFVAVVNLVQGLNQRQSGETGPGTERIVGSAVAVVLAIIVMASPNMLVYSLALIALVAGGMLVYAALKAPKQLVR